MNVSSSSGSESDDDYDVPSRETCMERIDKFVAVTGTNEALAQMRLQRAKWDLEGAIERYFEKEAKALGVSTRLSVKPPSQFTYLTWNIDGLDQKSLSDRTAAVVEQIEAAQVTIVCLQEVVPETLKFIKSKLANYQVFCDADDGDGYFTAVLLRRLCVYHDSSWTIPYPSTRMGRGLQIVECHIGAAKICVMNTHLESTADHTQERVKQLKTCFKAALEQPEGTSVILGGDMNLRDSDVTAAGGIPAGLEDLWIRSGSRKECQWTWDMMRNTNKEMPGRFKPRCRFDRVYIRDSHPKRVTEEHFGLFGLEKIRGGQRFPSDHWGILVPFTINSN